MFSKNKINIYDYSDYRKFLQEFYELEKSLDPTFSYRVFATAVNMDASLLVKILQGKRHVSPKCIETFVQFFRFKEAKAEYFREMVAYGKAKTDEQVRKHFETFPCFLFHILVFIFVFSILKDHKFQLLLHPLAQGFFVFKS